MVQDNGKETTLALKLRVWRQRRGQPGAFEEHALPAVPTSASFLEMMDMLNEQLIKAGQDTFAFDHDCREGICGMCSMTINECPASSSFRKARSSLAMSSKCSPVVGSSKRNNF